MVEQATEERKFVSAWIETTLAERLDEAARGADRSRSAELRVAVRQYLAQADDGQEDEHD
jgi:metal-responsive CopG/Arc/MetJ family transcriptional regulator